ncbi:MAG: 6,7-dimethyl-8-ribityllumazine synthase [Candidatus Omnitrophica bacterium]|nr:6,7-dimethyl-8-ribityllumazine synthase [Candidatus Omnitrophota bacterium]
MRELKGTFSGQGKKIAIVVSRFNEFISKELLQGCVDTLQKSGVTEEHITVIWAPGAYEIPQVLSRMDTAQWDAIITLGAVIRGETPHFDYIAAEVAKGVASLALARKVPVIFGILTSDTVEQAIERSGTKQGNKGRDAALAALEMAALYGQL